MKAEAALLTLILTWLAPTAPAQNVSVLMQHNDLERTGANLQEMQLTPATVRAGFGQLGFLPVNGQVYAQPLVVSGVKIPGKGRHSVVYVATMKNYVYAFDADHPEDASPIWTSHLGDPVYYKYIPDSAGPLLGLYEIEPWIGISSTPAIDPAKNRLWVVAKTMESGDIRYRLHCLDITTGNVIRSSPPIEAGTTNEVDRLQTTNNLQRPGLLFANGMVYVAFGSHQDGGNYHGWIIAFDAKTLVQKYVFCTTPGDPTGKGGIWQSGNGPAMDSKGNLYVMTGNGTFSPGHQYGSSFVKLSPELKVLDSFTPSNYKLLSDKDLDLGSSGPVLLPHTDELVGGGKQGYFYLLDCHKMGGLQHKHSDAPALEEFKVSDHRTIPWLGHFFPVFGYHHIHAAPVYWESAKWGRLVYVWPEESRIKAYRFEAANRFRTRPVMTGLRAPMGMPGGTLSISADGKKDGLLWSTTSLKGSAEMQIVRGVFRVFDADTLKVLWSSDKDPLVENFDYAKFCAPTVANGKVYVATFSDRVDVYGLLKTETPMAARANRGKAIPSAPRYGRKRM